MTPTLEKNLDAFYRRILRISINYRYPKTISNDKLYTLTQETPISHKIRKRRLTLFGHILRLDPETPVQKALQFYMTPHPRPVGRPPLTWITLISKDLEKTLKHHNIKTPLIYESLEKLKILAEDRTIWRKEILRNKDRNI